MTMAKILAIDDNNDNLISLRAIINDAFPGSTTYFALNGQKGIELAVENNPDVILLDIIMPEMDGFEVCRYLKQDERVSDIPVVFLTALKGDKENRIKALNVGAEGFLSKPIDETELIAQVRAMVKIKNATEQKRNEKERLAKLVEERTNLLAKSEARLQGIFNNLQDAYFQADLAGSFTVVSPSATKMYGYSSSELIGLKAQMLYADPLIRDSLFLQLQSKGKVEDFVCRGKKKDGSSFWVSMNVQFLRDGDGQITGTEGVVRDISERKNAEQNLRESEERFKRISSSISDISYSCKIDAQGDPEIDWLYGATEKMTGYSVSELMGMKCWGKLVIEDDFPIFKRRILGALPGKSEICELRIKKKDGNIVWVQASADRVTNDSFSASLYGGLTDITGRKEAETLLKESEERFKLVFKAANVAQSITLPTGEVNANQAFCNMFGYTEAELSGIKWQDLTFPDEVETDQKLINLILSGERSSARRMKRYVHKNGSILWGDVSFALIRDHNGNPLHFITTIVDVTERKQAEDALRLNNTRLGLAMDVANMSWWEMDIETGNVVFEKRKAEMLGYAPETFKHYTHFMELVHPEDYEPAMNAMRNHLSGATDKYEIEYRIKKASGDYKWFYDIGSVVNRDDQGKPLTVAGLVLDISERKKSELEVKEINARLGLVLENTPIAIWDWNLKADTWIATSKYYTMLGYEAEMGFSDREIWIKRVHPDEREIVQSKIKKVLLHDDDDYSYDARMLHADGSYRWQTVIGHVVSRDESGKATRMLGVRVDIDERKRTELALKESNELNASLLQTIPFAIDIVDEQGTILFQNETLKNLFERDAIGQKCWELYRDDKRQCSDCPLLKGIKIGETETYESCGVLGGRTFQISHTGMLFDGKKALLEIFQDITERKQAEQALKESVQLFQGLFNASPDAIVLIDPHHPTISWPVVDCNQACCNMNGYTREEMIGKSIDVINVVDGTVEERKTYLDRLRKAGVLHTEAIHHHRDGHNFPVEISTSIVNIGGRELILGIDRDITERKKMEKELIEAKEKAEKTQRQLAYRNNELVARNKFIQTILDNLPIGVSLNQIDDGTATYMNRKFMEIYGWSSSEVTSVSSFFEHVYPDADYREALMKQIIGDIQSGDPDRMHWENIFVTRKDGSRRVVNAVNIPLPEQNMMVSTVSDITDLHKTQDDLIAAKEKAEESDRLKSAFLANMSHEIRTPLNSIIGFSELLTDAAFDETQQAEFAQMINENGNSLLSILSDIMDLSKIEAGQIQVKKSEFIANRLANEIKNEFSFKAKANGIEIRLNLPDNDILVYSDESKIRQILVNLVSNALKFTPHGYIEIGLCVLADQVRFHVKDTGIGIPPDFHQQIFERFRQVDMSFTRKYGGTGLGLAISRSLAELLGGKIWVESEVGQGATFCFTLPVE